MSLEKLRKDHPIALLRTTTSIHSCHTIWDARNARFTKCSLPFLSAVPALLGAAILLCCVLGLIFKRLHWQRPRWLRPFAKEVVESRKDLNGFSGGSTSFRLVQLSLFSLLGLVLQVVTAFFPAPRIETGLVAGAWAVILVVLALERPHTVSVPLLIQYTSIFIVQIILIVHLSPATLAESAPQTLSLLLAVATIAISLNMPFRSPLLSTAGISPAFSTPNSQLRSPEDNLSLWQFMAVTWMSPMIKAGSKRTLNDEDVWDLAHEFKHTGLHEHFRALEGSVLKRILTANAIDLVLIGLYGVVELLSNLAAPVLLQQLLRSMERPGVSKNAAVVYAVLSMVVRLVAAQADILGLWFSRRAYERSRGELITMLSEKTLSRKMIGLANDVNAGTEDESASMGKIMNLIRFDAYEVAQRFWEFEGVVEQPLNLVLCTTLIWKILGPSALIGVATVFVAQLTTYLLARGLIYWEKKRRLATDSKLEKIAQFVEAIRHLRWYGWQDIWLKDILDARQNELKLRIITGLWNVLISFTNNFSTGVFPVAAFYGYTVLAGKPLRVDVAFPALQLFGMLESTLRQLPDLIRVFLNASVALGRVQKFMNEPDRDEGRSNGLNPGSTLKFSHASFAWPGSLSPVLSDISLEFRPGLTLICGEVAAGKTALLQALIGELDLLGGVFERPPDMIGYGAQSPWLQDMSLKENILFAAPFDQARYDDVLDACALRPDFSTFSDGDLTHIGENGTGLSGGQKARLALARAVYSRSPILLLDDPLSSLDAQTAEIVVRDCLTGPLLKGRTTILVTHRTEFVIDKADQVVEISNGTARIIDRSSTHNSLRLTGSAGSGHESRQQTQANQVTTAAPLKFTDDEYRAHGGVEWNVYWEYVKAGKLRWWSILVFVLALYRLVDVAETWFLKSWGEAYDRPVTFFLMGQDAFHTHWEHATIHIQKLSSLKEFFDNLPSPEVNIRPWLIGFLVLAVVRSVVFVITQCFSLVVIYKAGRQMFADVMDRVSHATFRFYDVTPVGRLMNRLTGDCSTIDGNISAQFQRVATLSILWVSSLVVIASVTPIFLIFSLVLTVALVLIFLRFLPTSQSLRRLEMVSLSPLMSNFGQILYGMTTIRAFHAQERFQGRVITVTNTFQKMDHFYWTLQAWLIYRFDTLSAFSTFLLTVLAIYTQVSAGLAAFVLTAAAKFVFSTHMLCRSYGQLQMDFVSVERVVELLHLDKEPPGTVQPPAWWPSLSGDIEFHDATLRYAPHLEPALSNITLRIKAGSNTALLGRTGSGKSTLALSLLATTLPKCGRILIDGIDIATVDTQALRTRITFLAQDPVLFPGRMRKNLDPLSEHTDESCSSVLHKIAARHGWTLETQIEPGGRNLSQGQRQLVGLARAVLRRSPIVIFDEATASIDLKTSLEIQKILREELRGSTVLTIAHRLEAVQDADYCIILEKGRLKKYGKADEMMASE